MTKQYSKILDEQDYYIFEEMNFIESTKEGLSGTFYPLHQHRNWEYGLCLHALRKNGAVNILEVGGAGSLFAACAAWLGMKVTVVDPSSDAARLFSEQNLILLLGYAPITFHQVDFFHYRNRKKFDAVVCFHTLEQIAEDVKFFTHLLELVKEDGIVFLTVDFHPSGHRFIDGHLRTYNQQRLESFISLAQTHGFDILGKPSDYSWKQEAKNTYTFASLALKRKKREEFPVILFVNNQMRKRDGVYQFGKRIGNILEYSQKYRFIYLEADSKEKYWETIERYKPRGAIYNLHLVNTNMPWIDSSLLHSSRARGMFQMSIFHDLPFGKGFDYYIATYPDFPESEAVFSTPRPLLDYKNAHPVSHIPIINCFGFVGDQDFVQLAEVVNQEFDSAIVNFHMPHNDIGYGESPSALADACRSAITKKDIVVHVTHTFMPEDELLDFLAKGSLNVFLYSYRRGRAAASTLDFALSVKRPIAITKSNAMAHVFNARPSICIEERSLKEIMETGFTPLEPYYQQWRPEKLIDAYEKIVEKIL